MKTKSRNKIFSFLLTLTMLLGVFAMTPLTASAVSITPTPEETPAETVWVGGVELGAGQYVKNGETTATTGEPAEDADGYAYYKADGTLLLASYSYEGDGYEYDSGMYAVIYSSGALSVELRGENVLKQTSEGKRGIFAVGNLEIDGVGSLSVSADWSIYSNGIITFKETLGKVDLTVTGTGRAIVSLYDSGSATDHDESIFVKGGDISATTYYGLDDLVITGGALTISSSYYALNMHPVINYDGEYTAVVSDNEDGSDSVAYDPAKLVTEIPNNYFRITPAPKTAIDSVSVSGIDLPEFGEAFNAEVDLDALTYGGEYKVADHWLEKYTGDEWVEYTGRDDLIEYGVRYRYVLSLMPNGGYSFSSEITDGVVKINDKAATVYKITEYPFYNAVEIACEFSYEATFITSISISGVDLPEVGDKSTDMAFASDTLTYGGAYIMAGRGVQKFDGTEWVNYIGEDDLIEYGVRYRVSIVLAPTRGYDFSAELSSSDVTVNGNAATLEALIPAIGVNNAAICVEFSYDVPVTPITSISVSGADLPEVGETKDVMEFTPDSLTYGGEYKMVGRGFQKYTGTEWVDVSDTESLEYGVKYRVNLVLAPNEGYAFADTITSDDVTFNGEKGAFDTLIPGAGYASIYYEFYYEVPDYGITIADKDEHGATVGVLITEENYADVLGDGTVSYDPTTNTLTLNGYKYEGKGIADFGYLAITAEIEDDLVIVMIGENKISVNDDNGSGIIIFGDGNVILTGDGSLTVNASMFGISAQSSGFLAMESGNVTITCTGMPSAAITATNFYMAGGNLKLSSALLGIALMDSRSYIEIEGGTVEVSVNTAGYGFVYSAGGDMEFEPMSPNVYCFAYDAIASTKTDGSDADEYDWENYDTYKYVKISEKETYGILVSDKNESGETVGVYIDKNNYADVLGDGTVSYDPTTNTLTLNGYVYEGEGYWEHGIVGFIEEKLTVNLVGENRITVYDEYGTGIYFYGEGGVVFTGEGSLAVTSKGRGIDVSCETFEIKGGNITVNAPYAVGAYELKMIGGTLAVNASGEDTCGIDAFNLKMTGGTLTVTASGKNACAIYAVELAIAGGNLTITSSGEDACAIYTENGFVMNGGSLKINTDYRGISQESYSWLDVCGGTLEIFVGEAGYAFTYWDDDAGEYLLTIPYVEGESNIIASVNADGSGAVTFNEDDLATYKYVKITVKESYGIIVADKDGNGVMIDEKNYANPLGDGTVSYDPATHTLTLNGYKYEGSGFEDDGGYHGILVRPDFMDTLTIVLEGENEITLTTNDAGAMIILDTNAVIKGDGSLKVNSNRYGIYVEDSALEIQGGNTTINALYVVDVSDFTMNGGTLTVTGGGETPAIYARNFTMSSGMLTVTVGGEAPAIFARNFTMSSGMLTVTADGNGACAISSQNITMNGGTITVTMRGMGVCAIPVNSFTMNGGSIKISTAGFGIAMWSDSTFIICGGTLEISTKEAGCAFVLYDEDADEFLPTVPTFTGDYKMKASVNEDGSGAVEFEEEDFETYKYVSFHIHDYSTTWVTDENEHWNECACGDKANKAAHVDNDGDGNCDECEYLIGGGEITDTETETDDTTVETETETDDTAVETETETVESSEAESDTEKETEEDSSESEKVENDTEDETDTIGGEDDPDGETDTDEGETDTDEGESDTEVGGETESEVGTDPDIGKKPEDGLGVGAIVAIACGSAVVLGTGGFALVWFAIKKKTWADFLALFKKK